jgi:hypothetical protein
VISGTTHIALGDSGEEASLDVSRFVNTGGHALGDHFEKEIGLVSRGILEEIHQLGHLGRVEGLGGNTRSFGKTLSDMGVVLGLRTRYKG